jgi:hypothetical protein
VARIGACGWDRRVLRETCPNSSMAFRRSPLLLKESPPAFHEIAGAYRDQSSAQMETLRTFIELTNRRRDADPSVVTSEESARSTK